MDSLFLMSTNDRKLHTVNPNDLHELHDLNDLFDLNRLDYDYPGSYAPDPSASTDGPSRDSGVDLRSFQDPWSPVVKLEPMDNFAVFGETSQVSSTPSPAQDLIFSSNNSPGDFVRGQSRTSTSSPEAATAANLPPRNANASPQEDDDWKLFATPDVIHIPQSAETAKVYLFPDKTKTRAETQIRVQLILDPVGDKYEHMHFPRKTLAKPKLLASAEEKKEAEAKGESLYMDLSLICATAVEGTERYERAMRRARGEEQTPRRPQGVAISDLEKDDPAHPQNGGEVLICEGCKERERKRYDRKKKRAEDEDEWWKYEDDRIIMINEKEFKKWKEIESSDQSFSSRARQVEFAMRIACYCRHQEEKAPVGYRVIFTFKDSVGNLVAQHLSEIFQITDDHKNKEIAPEGLPRPLTIPTTMSSYVHPQYPHPNVVPIYQYPVEGQFLPPTAMNSFSQPPTPVMSSFHNPRSPLENNFSHPTTPTGLPRQSAHPQPFASSSAPAPPPFSRSHTHQPHQPQYEAPMLSPTSQVTPDSQYLPRPLSMDNFQFSSGMQYPHQGFASAPPSSVSTPLNLSRPASPTWEQGPTKKKMMCVFYYVDDDDNQQ
ncbi:hypothetical protein CC78DRAFT_344628 [Lojkania enalia]|uniref:SPT23/MGA2-like DNA-binding domain-containing protein n=1 Tax=Lojkania enalia TaxID=147567 RepID=A0A9P4K644_9PLEO|nr:hypothetical protein CC78DRAFT_344628 [Didymosphaeria enalia]